MAVNSSFFNSVSGDRIYQAANFAAYFASFIGNGVFPNPSTNLQVLQDVDRIVKVAPGKGWINGYYVENTSDFNIQIAMADGSLNRIDRIILGLNLTNRVITIYSKQGTPSTNPVAPPLIRTPSVYELALADIYVNTGAIKITQANILDQRMNGNLCGIVSGVVNQVDTTTLYNQYQDDFMEWSEQQREDFEEFLQGIENSLSGNVAGNLQNQINTKANINSPTFTGDPKVPDVAITNSSLSAANTKFVRNSINGVIQTTTVPVDPNPLWIRLGTIDINAGYATNKMSMILDGNSVGTANNYNTTLITVSSFGGMNLRVLEILSANATPANSTRYGYVNNNSTNKSDIWMMIPLYAQTMNMLKLGSFKATFDFATVVRTEPPGITYVTPMKSVDNNSMISYVGDKTSLLTENKTTTVGAINELFTSVSNGKNGIAAAIASKGVPTPEGASFGVLEANIRDIDMGVRYARGEIAVSSVTGQFARVSPSAGTQNRNYITVSGLNFFPARIFIYDQSETYTVEFNGIRRGSARSIIVSSSSGTPSFEIFSNSTLSAYVVNGGFRLPLSASSVQGSNVYWEAYAL